MVRNAAHLRQKYGEMAGVVKKLGEEFQAKVELAPAL
jgi:hypothetical protein